MNTTERKSTPLGLVLILAITAANMTLKCCGTITWPWIWVVSPLWIGALLLFVVLWVLNVAAFVARSRDDE